MSHVELFESDLQHPEERILLEAKATHWGRDGALVLTEDRLVFIRDGWFGTTSIQIPISSIETVEATTGNLSNTLKTGGKKYSVRDTGACRKLQSTINDLIQRREPQPNSEPSRSGGSHFSASSQKPWYDSTGLVVFFSIVIFPVGLWGWYKRRSLKRTGQSRFWDHTFPLWLMAFIPYTAPLALYGFYNRRKDEHRGHQTLGIAVSAISICSIFVLLVSEATAPKNTEPESTSQATRNRSNMILETRKERKGEIQSWLGGFPYSGSIRSNMQTYTWKHCYESPNSLVNCANLFSSFANFYTVLKSTKNLTHERFAPMVAQAQAKILPALRDRFGPAVRSSQKLDYQAMTVGDTFKTVDIWQQSDTNDWGDEVPADLETAFKILRIETLRFRTSKNGTIIHEKNLDVPPDTSLATFSSEDGWTPIYSPPESKRDEFLREAQSSLNYREVYVGELFEFEKFYARFKSLSASTRNGDEIARDGFVFLTVPYIFANRSDSQMHGPFLDLELHTKDGEHYLNRNKLGDASHVPTFDPGQNKTVWVTFEVPKQVTNEEFTLALPESGFPGNRDLKVQVSPNDISSF